MAVPATRFMSLLAASTACVFAVASVLTEGRESPAPQGNPPVYIGVRQCAAAACHGRDQPGEANIRQDEFTVWASRDRHSRAFDVLLNERSRTMARHLGIGKAEESTRCLACHSITVPAGVFRPSFEPAEGVGCEACHGPASRWLSQHYTRDFQRRQGESLGMLETEDLRARAARCASCHLGTAEKSVGHDLLAAGHPELVFELDAFQSRMPPHWKPRTQEALAARHWVVGQAILIRDSMRLLAHRLADEAWKGWPDFADYDCGACHHRLTTSSFRQQRGYRGAVGAPSCNESAFLVYLHFLRRTLPEAASRVESLFADLRRHLGRIGSERRQARERALGLAEGFDRIAAEAGSLPLDAPLLREVMADIAADADAIADDGLRTAEQAALALDALLAARIELGQDDPAAARSVQQLKSLVSVAYRREEVRGVLRALAVHLQ